MNGFSLFLYTLFLLAIDYVLLFIAYGLFSESVNYLLCVVSAGRMTDELESMCK